MAYIEWSTLATKIVLAGATMGALTKWFVVPLWKAVRAVYLAISFIQHELSENSGRSIKDMTLRNDARFEHLFDHLGIEMPDALKTPKEGTPE